MLEEIKLLSNQNLEQREEVTELQALYQLKNQMEAEFLEVELQTFKENFIRDNQKNIIDNFLSREEQNLARDCVIDFADILAIKLMNSKKAIQEDRLLKIKNKEYFFDESQYLGYYLENQLVAFLEFQVIDQEVKIENIYVSIEEQKNEITQKLTEAVLHSDFFEPETISEKTYQYKK